MVRYPPLALSFTQAHLCDTPLCNVSRDNCAIPHENKQENVLRYYRYKVSRDMKSIVAGPLRLRHSSGAKKNPKAKKHRTNSTKEFSEQFEGTTL